MSNMSGAPRILSPLADAGGRPPVVMSIDVTNPLVHSSPNNRGAVVSVRPGQMGVAIADMRAQPNIGRGMDVVLGSQQDGLLEEFVDEASFLDAYARATVKWSIGSASFLARCDWIEGTQLSLGAEQISVSADYFLRGYSSAEPNFVPDASCCKAPSLLLSAGFAWGTTGRNSNGARLTELVEVAPEGKVRIPIPPFAISFTVALADPSTTATVDVVGYGTKFKNRVEITGPMTNVNQTDSENAFPIRGGARFLEVINPTSDSTLLAFVIFGLSL